jgi:MFS family permease
MVACGGAVAFTAFSTSFSHLVISQLMLGLFEASILSCCVMVVSRMYRRSEQPRRISFFVFGDGMAMILSGVVGFGVGHIDTTDSLRSWQWFVTFDCRNVFSKGVIIAVFLLLR